MPDPGEAVGLPPNVVTYLAVDVDENPAIGAGRRSYLHFVSRFIIRDALPADLATIVQLYADDVLGRHRELPTVPLPTDYERAFQEIDSDPRHHLVVGDEDGQVVGTLQLSFIPHLVLQGGERAQIEAVRIRSDKRGTGLGDELVGWAIERARERSCRLVQLTTNADREDERRFYERLGFVPLHVGMKLML